MVEKDENLYVMRKFILPPIGESKQACQNCLQSQLKMSQMANVVKVRHMLELKPQTSFLNSLWPQDAVQHPENNPYSFLNLNKPNQAIYTIEEHYGQSLDVIVSKRKEHFPQQEVVAMLQQLGSTLLALQQKGIAHRNLQLKNILYAGEVKLSEVQLPLLQHEVATDVKQAAVQLGRVMLSVCCLQKAGGQEEQLGQVEAVYGTELRRVLSELLDGQLRVSELVSPKLVPFATEVLQRDKNQKQFRRVTTAFTYTRSGTSVPTCSKNSGPTSTSTSRRTSTSHLTSRATT